MSHPAIFTPTELKLRKRLRFRRWYVKNVTKQRRKSRDFHGANRALSASRCAFWHRRNQSRARFLRQRWHRSNPVKVRIGRARAIRKRRADDPAFALLSRLRCRVNIALKNSGCLKSAKTVELIGCTIPELRVHLEALFKPGMSWENHGPNGWHIDHRIACAEFDLSDAEQQQRCFHFSNLQPLWSGENQRKELDRRKQRTQTLP